MRPTNGNGTQKAQEMRSMRFFLCFLCPLCASCVLFLFPLGKAPMRQSTAVPCATSIFRNRRRWRRDRLNPAPYGSTTRKAENRRSQQRHQTESGADSYRDRAIFESNRAFAVGDDYAPEYAIHTVD